MRLPDQTTLTAARVSESRAAVFCPLVSPLIRAGFPSPADDFVDRAVDLNEELITNPMATFFVRVTGESMIGAGIGDGDTLLVDRSIRASDGHIIVARLDDEFTIKRLRRAGMKVFLVPENDAFDVIEVRAENEFEVWGVVTWVVHRVR